LNSRGKILQIPDEILICSGFAFQQCGNAATHVLAGGEFLNYLCARSCDATDHKAIHAA